MGSWAIRRTALAGSGWTWAFAIALGILVILLPRLVVAQSDEVPADLQAELFAKVAPYDRHFAQRAGSAVRIVVLQRPDSAKSRLSAVAMKAALGRLVAIGGLPHQESIESYMGPEALAAHCRADQISAVYVPPGFDSDIEGLRTSLTGADVITFTPVSDYVQRGVVLGFEIDVGHPRLLVNLEQARHQNVDLPAPVLALMKVFR
jgi:hypothetical protein